MSTADAQPYQQTLTALFFGFVVGTVLFGVTLLESYRYFKSYRDDPIQQKLLVALLVCLDTSQFAFSIHAAYHYLVKSFGDPDAISNVIWSIKAVGTVQVGVIWLYLCRIWGLTKRILSHKKLVVPVLLTVIIIGMTGLGTGIIFLWKLWISKFVTLGLLPCLSDLGVCNHQIDNLAGFSWTVYLAFGVVAAIDSAIATIMILILHKSITGIQRTDGVISALIQYFFSTGLLTSLSAILYIVLFAVRMQNALYLGMVFLISRLYVISLLELFNVRKQLREDLNEVIEIGFSSVRFTVPVSAAKGGSSESSSEPSTV